MNNQPRKFYCEDCNEEVLTDVRREEREFVVKDETVKVTIETRYCCKCGQTVWDEEIEERNEKIVFDEYRAKKKFLSPAEIKAIREAIGISQSAFSRLLGFGAKTITRYEGGAPQDTAHNLLILCMKDKKNVKRAFEANSSALSSREKAQIRSYLAEGLTVDMIQLPQSAKRLQTTGSLTFDSFYKMEEKKIYG